VQLESKGQLDHGQRAKIFLSALGMSKPTFKCHHLCQLVPSTRSLPIPT